MLTTSSGVELCAVVNVNVRGDTSALAARSVTAVDTSTVNVVLNGSGCVAGVNVTTSSAPPATSDAGTGVPDRNSLIADVVSVEWSIGSLKWITIAVNGSMLVAPS